MFLSCNLSIALINVPCKSSHCIIRLMPSVGVCHLDSNGCALEQEYRTRGGWEDERMSRGWEDERTRGREDDKKRIGWEQRYRVCREVVDFVRRDLLCHKEEGRGSEGERCREGSLSTERWASVREFDQLEWWWEGREGAKQSWEAATIWRKLGPPFLDAHGRQETESRK
jgi:hypothetical protein